MCDSRARRKRNSKLQKLSKNLDNSHAIMEYYEAEIKSMEEDDNSSPPAEQPQIQWYQPLLPQPPTWNVLHDKDKNPTLQLVNSITE